MTTQQISEAEAFYAFLGEQISNGGVSKSPEELLRLWREMRADWNPRTALGAQLKKLREQFIREGGKLLSSAEVKRELQQRQGKGFSEVEGE